MRVYTPMSFISVCMCVRARTCVGVHLSVGLYCCQALQERRQRCRDVDSDVIVWTNQRLKQWADQVDLHVCSPTLCQLLFLCCI